MRTCSRLLQAVLLLLLLVGDLRLDPAAAAAETVALWLFDERPGIYPSSVLADAGPNGYPLVLGRGGRLTEGRFGYALEACDPIPIDIQGRSKSVLFGLTPAPTLPGRTVAPMTWQTAHFCGLATAGERHLRRMEFVNPTESGLNLGAHDWTIEFWFKPAADPKGPGVVFEIGEGPRGENDHVTRLTLGCSQARFVLVNQPAAIELPVPSTPTAFPPAARAWHHFAFVYSAAAEQLHHYVDGTLQPLPGRAHIQPLPRGEEAYCSVGVYFHYHDDGPPARRELGRRERGRGSGATETQLAASRDGLAWRRYPRPAYVGNGRHEGMDIHMAYLAQGMALRGEEIWQYYLGSAFYHSPWKDGNRAVFRLVQRRDGFVSADAPYTGGRLVTKPLRCAGDRLVLNIDTDAAGYAQVGLLDDAGKPIPCFGIEDCIYLNGDFIEAEVEWLGKGKDLGSLAGRTVQVELEMHGAKLYALQFKTANEPVPTDPAASASSAVSRRPLVLLLGDSISIGYAPAVRDLLRGKADVCHPCDTVESNCESTRKGLERLDVWLGYQAWDVVHFNFGLHDLKYVDERGAMVAVERGRPLTPPDQYEHNLRTLVDRLKRTRAKLIFATTTPVPPGAIGRVAGDEARYNEAAVRVMTRAGVPVDDLHAFAQPRLAEIQRPANVHFTADGSRELARAVSDAIERELAR